MGKWETVRHRVAIAGKLTDAGTGKPMSGAVVVITKMPAAFKGLLEAKAMQHGERWAAMSEKPDRTRTAADGLFYFMDLPDGQYTLAAALASKGKRYGTAQGTATVSRHKNGDFAMAFLELALEPTTVRGKITDSGGKNGVVMAEVHVKGSGERTFSDAEGQYVLAGIEPSESQQPAPGGARPLSAERTILVFAQGYRPESQRVTVEKAGASKTLDFMLVRQAG
jgi:hypothetical protein